MCRIQNTREVEVLSQVAEGSIDLLFCIPKYENIRYCIF